MLNHYKDSDNASLAEWPTHVIGYNPLTLNNKFYSICKKWFSDQNIRIIEHNGRKRYLSTFILAAEFPPKLGFARIIKDLVIKYGWLALYQRPVKILEEFSREVSLEGYTVVQRKALEPDSDGLTALLNLVRILATIRYYLDSPDQLEKICSVVARKNDWDLDLVHRVALSYKEQLIPSQGVKEKEPLAKFSYHLTRDERGWSLSVKHNLNKPTSVLQPSSFELSQLSSGSLLVQSDSTHINLPFEQQVVKLETSDEYIKIETSLTENSIQVELRDLGLKNIQFLVSVQDKKSIVQHLHLGEISRTEDFLVFNEQGTEIINSSRLYKKEQKIRLIPLSKQIWEAMDNCSELCQLENTGTLPIYEVIGTPSEVSFADIVLEFVSVPFSIEFRKQDPWEQTFNQRGKKHNYFFNSRMKIYLQGDFPEGLSPSLELNRLVKQGGEVKKIPINCSYSDGIISPNPKFDLPGKYELTVQFIGDHSQTTSFVLLPIRSMALIRDKTVRIKFRYSIEDFDLITPEAAEVTIGQSKQEIDITCLEYGLHEIYAQYMYTDNSSNRIKSRIRFRFKAEQEVIGHFSRVIEPGESSILTIEEDLMLSSSLRFNRTSLRGDDSNYRITVYLEDGDGHQRLFPEKRTMQTEGSRPYSLDGIVKYIHKYQYSRVLLVVDIGGIELFRASFSDEKRAINDLVRDWERGSFSSLEVLPLDTLKPKTIYSLKELPTNCLVYGMVEMENGKDKFATYGYYHHPSPLVTNDIVSTFLSACNESVEYNEETYLMLQQILNDPKDSYALMEWLSSAHRWHYPYDIHIYAKILETFPLIVAWAELARNPEDRNTFFALLSKEAKFLNSTGDFFFPEIKKMHEHPRFSPELITVGDISQLAAMNLLPIESNPIKLFYFCTLPYTSGTKPVLSWLTLFWLYGHCSRLNIMEEFYSWFEKAENNLLLVTGLAKEYVDNLPVFNKDRNNQQNFYELLASECKYYSKPLLNQIEGLDSFINKLDTQPFTFGLTNLLKREPLIKATPLLEGFQESTKWKAIIFLSLTAVCTQLERQPFLDKLHQLMQINQKTYIYLLKWVNNREETAYIYNAYYEYWMTLFWEDTYDRRL